MKSWSCSCLIYVTVTHECRRYRTANAGVLGNNGKVTVKVHKSVTESRPICRHSARLRFVHEKLERTSVNGRAVVRNGELVLADLSRSEGDVHRSVFVVDDSRLHSAAGRHRYRRCVTHQTYTSISVTRLGTEE